MYSFGLQLNITHNVSEKSIHTYIHTHTHTYIYIYKINKYTYIIHI